MVTQKILVLTLFMVWVSKQKLISQFSSKMHQEGCGGIVLTKKRQKIPILGIHIKNYRISIHTENLLITLFMVWVREQKLIIQFFSQMHQEGCGWRSCIAQKKVKKPNFGNTHKKAIE